MRTKVTYITHNEDSEPILIENLDVFKNSVGQWVVNFDSVNHKYLEEISTFSGGHWENGELQSEHGIEFGTFETFVDPKDDTWVGWDSFMRIDSRGGHFGKFHWSNSDTRKGDFFGKLRFGRDAVDLWNRTVSIALIPESKEEKEEINGTFCVLPLKWCYQIAIIPYEHFYRPTSNSEI